MRALVVSCVFAVACAKSVPPPKAPEPPPEKPAPAPAVDRAEHDDGMKIEGQLGSIPDEAIEGAFKARWPDVARCSHAAQMRLAYLNGTVELKVRVGADGVPTKAYVERSTLGNYDAERCVLEIARGLTFPPPKGGLEAEFSFPIEVKARRPSSVLAWEEARIAPTAVRSRADAVVCKGGEVAPKKGKRRNVVVAPSPAAAIELPPNVVLTLYVAPGGKVASAGLAGGGPIDEKFASCLVTRAQRWKVDDPRGQVAKATIMVAQ